MKKLKLVLCLIACILGVTACGSKEKETLSVEKSEAAQSRAEQVIQGAFLSMDQDTAAQMKESGNEYVEYIFESVLSMKVEGNGMIGAFDSWVSAQKDMGTFVSIDGYTAKYYGKDIVVNVSITGSKKTAVVEFIFADDMYLTLKSAATNVDFTLGEKMIKASLNTLLGMGTVFAVLILISLIISCFSWIPKIQKAFDNSDKKDSSATSSAVNNTIAQIIQKEELTGDPELVAVITAAIAAAGTTTGSSDKFVVRSIKRRKNKWQRA